MIPRSFLLASSIVLFVTGMGSIFLARKHGLVLFKEEKLFTYPNDKSYGYFLAAVILWFFAILSILLYLPPA